MLNTKITSFKCISYFKKKFYEFNSANFKNYWNVLFCFPYSFSFICPTELIELSNFNNLFKLENCNLYGLSTDSHFVHKNWVENYLNINFPLLSDFNSNISIKNKIYNKKDGNCLRATIIIDPNLIIRSYDLIDINISRSIQNILERIKMLNFISKNKNEICPINWIKDFKSIKL